MSEKRRFQNRRNLVDPWSVDTPPAVRTPVGSGDPERPLGTIAVGEPAAPDGVIAEAQDHPPLQITTPGEPFPPASPDPDGPYPRAAHADPKIGQAVALVAVPRGVRRTVEAIVTQVHDDGQTVDLTFSDRGREIELRRVPHDPSGLKPDTWHDGRPQTDDLSR